MKRSLSSLLKNVEDALDFPIEDIVMEDTNQDITISLDKKSIDALNKKLELLVLFCEYVLPVYCFYFSTYFPIV